MRIVICVMFPVQRVFTRYVTHEIRTPLNTIFLGLRLLENKVGVQDEQATAECIREIKTSTQIALDVVNDLLTCDKIQSHTLILDKAYCSPGDLVKGAISPMHLQVT